MIHVISHVTWCQGHMCQGHMFLTVIDPTLCQGLLKVSSIHVYKSRDLVLIIHTNRLCLLFYNHYYWSWTEFWCCTSLIECLWWSTSDAVSMLSAQLYYILHRSTTLPLHYYLLPPTLLLTSPYHCTTSTTLLALYYYTHTYYTLTTPLFTPFILPLIYALYFTPLFYPLYVSFTPSYRLHYRSDGPGTQSTPQSRVEMWCRVWILSVDVYM